MKKLKKKIFEIQEIEKIISIEKIMKEFQILETKLKISKSFFEITICSKSTITNQKCISNCHDILCFFIKFVFSIINKFISSLHTNWRSKYPSQRAWNNQDQNLKKFQESARKVFKILLISMPLMLLMEIMIRLYPMN